MERQRLRWLALAATVAAVALVVAVAAAVLGGSVGVVLVAAGASVVVLPLATGAAILRYRLYDLDRIVSRTLAVAAAFQPARRHIQRAVDRQFNRRRHDAARIIEAFGARLRDQVDLDSLTAELLGRSTRSCSQPKRRSGYGPNNRPTQWPTPGAHEGTGKTWRREGGPSFRFLGRVGIRTDDLPITSRMLRARLVRGDRRNATARAAGHSAVDGWAG